MHRRLQSPAMYGNADAPLKLRMELNMDTDKAVSGRLRTTFIHSFPVKIHGCFSPTRSRAFSFQVQREAHNSGFCSQQRSTG